jgi:hypothetical protein
METEEQAPARKPGRKKVRLIVGCLAILLAVASCLFLWQASRPNSLLPGEARALLDAGYTPYYYFDSIPAGYTLRDTQIDNDLAVFTLGKKGSPTIALTQQQLPAELDTDELIQDSDEKIRDTAQEAILNSVEGRKVAVMIDKQGGTLIILNAPRDTDKEDIKSLVRGLRPVK